MFLYFFIPSPALCVDARELLALALFLDTYFYLVSTPLLGVPPRYGPSTRGVFFFLLEGLHACPLSSLVLSSAQVDMFPSATISPFMLFGNKERITLSLRPIVRTAPLLAKQPYLRPERPRPVGSAQFHAPSGSPFLSPTPPSPLMSNIRLFFPIGIPLFQPSL